MNLSPRIFLLITLVVLLSACQAGNETTATDVPQQQQVTSAPGSPTQAPLTTVLPTDVPPESMQSLWEASTHADTYVVDALGMNSSCARCHAPLNFIPSMDDMPESCAACKFEVDPPPPTIAESDWEDISCIICHRMKKGEAQPEYAWLSIPPIEEYEEVATTTDLCIKCHTAESIAGHTGFSVAGAHADYTCTQCHEAHSAVATCASEVCHADVINPATPIPGHDVDHKAVACWTCHDASGLTVGQAEDGQWITQLSETGTSLVSHNVVKEALCERCHFLMNPWNLSPDVSKVKP